MKRESSDLFGEPLLKRSAHFPAPGIRRRLSRDWGQGRRALLSARGPSFFRRCIALAGARPYLVLAAVRQLRAQSSPVCT